MRALYHVLSILVLRPEATPSAKGVRTAATAGTDGLRWGNTGGEGGLVVKVGVLNMTVLVLHNEKKYLKRKSRKRGNIPQKRQFREEKEKRSQ